MSYAIIWRRIIFCRLLVTFNFSKTLMVLLICVAFAGQTMASTIMSYQMMSMKGMSGQEQSQDMSMMDHSNHNMVVESSENSDKSMEDCCNQTCSCFTGSCSSLAAFTKDIVGNEPLIDLSSKIFSYSNLALSQQSTSLYRPPILS
jgi:hypothetical protein